MAKEPLKGNVDPEVRKQFEENIKLLEGSPYGLKGRGLETALKIFNNYFSEIHETKLIKIAKELNLEPWEVGKVLITIGIPVYNRYGIKFFEYCMEKGVPPEEGHLKLVDKFFEEMVEK